jgi:carbonic anhydrase
MGKKNFWIVAFLLAFALVSQVRASGDAGPGMSPDEALQMLKDGNSRYVGGAPKHPNSGQERRDLTVSKGQHPFATVLSCSDSRVPVEVLFDAGIGDVFVIRVAGNVADVDEIGSIEYGVDHLGTPVLVVLGHTKCGAVTAVAQNAHVHGSIPQLVDNIAPAVEKAKAKQADLTGDALIEAAIKENVWQSVEDLLKSSEATRNKVKSGSLKIVGAIYDLSSGKIDWLGSHPEQDKLVAATGK